MVDLQKLKILDDKKKIQLRQLFWLGYHKI